MKKALIFTSDDNNRVYLSSNKGTIEPVKRKSKAINRNMGQSILRLEVRVIES